MSKFSCLSSTWEAMECDLHYLIVAFIVDLSELLKIDKFSIFFFWLIIFYFYILFQEAISLTWSIVFGIQKLPIMLCFSMFFVTYIIFNIFWDIFLFYCYISVLVLIIFFVVLTGKGLTQNIFFIIVVKDFLFCFYHDDVIIWHDNIPMNWCVSINFANRLPVIFFKSILNSYSFTITLSVPWILILSFSNISVDLGLRFLSNLLFCFKMFIIISYEELFFGNLIRLLTVSSGDIEIDKATKNGNQILFYHWKLNGLEGQTFTKVFLLQLYP